MTIKTGDKTKAQIIADANIDKVQWNKNLNYHALKAIKTAEAYTPAVSGDWAVQPVTQDIALNALAAATTDLVTVSGVAANAVNLGTFSGSTINDNVTIKAALQALETSLESKASAANVSALITLSGVAANAVSLGTFTGSTIADNVTVKAAAQSLETAVEAVKGSHRIMFARLGAGLITTALTGLVAGDIVISIISDGTVTVALCAAPDTLPADPADTTWLVVLRAIA